MAHTERHPVSSRGAHAFFRRLVERRGRVLAGAAVVLATASAGAARLTLDYSVEQFFPGGGPARAAYDRFRSSFPEEDAQVVVLLESRERSPSSGRAAARNARTADRIARAFRAVGLRHVHAVEPDPGRPELDGILWGSGGRVRAVVGNVPKAANDDAGRARIEADLSERLAALELPAGSWVLTGTPVIRARVADLFARDQAVLLGGGIVAFLVVLWITFGGGAPAVAALATVLPAYLVTLGVMGFAGRPVTLLTGFTVVVVLVVGLCDVVHLLAGVHRSRDRFDSPEAAVVDAFARLVVPCFYTSLTTALGFAALAFTGVGIVVEFGLLTALAVLLTWTFAMTLLPAALTVRWAPAPTAGGPLPGILERLSNHARAVAGRGRRRRIVSLFAVVTVASLFGIGRLTVDTRLVDDLRPDSPVLRDLRWAQDRGFGVFQLNVFLEDVETGELARDETLRWLGETEVWLREQPLVMAALGPATAMADAPGLAGSLIDPDAGRAQILATVPDVGSGRLVPLMERVEARIEEAPPPVGRATLTGTVTMAQTFSSRLLGSFGPSLALAVALITAVMAWMFRSLRLGVLALLPNLFPLAVLGGCLALLGIALKPSTILVFSIAFGIAVDDSVHLMARYTAVRRRGATAGDAVDDALAEAGPAILLTTAMVIVGFSLLLLSSFQVLALVGGMSMVAASAAVAADLYLFPALLAGGHVRPSLRGIGFPVGRRLEVRVFVRPGRRLGNAPLSRLTADLRRVAAECLGGGKLRYGVLSGERDRMARAVIAVLRDRTDGRPLGFTAATLVPVELDGRPRRVLHMGLSMVVPGARRRGLTRLLVTLPPVVILLRSGLRPVWVTNVSQVPAAVGMFAESVSDLHPARDGDGEPPRAHHLIAEQLMTRHRAVFGVGDEARFDPHTFVIHNAYTGGSDPLRKEWSAVSLHRDVRWNRFCRLRLDYRRGDDVLQVGRFTVGHTVRALRRFAIRAVRLRSVRLRTLDVATSARSGGGPA